MHYARAEEHMHCGKCGDGIPVGAACLSQLPQKVPSGIRRADYVNFCAGCFEWDLSSEALPMPCCALSRQQLALVKVEVVTFCHCCGDAIPPNAEAFVWTFFAWPAEHGSDAPKPGHTGPVSWVSRSRKGDWDALSPRLQRKFVRAGLGGGRGVRTRGEARQLYERSTPRDVRNAGEPAIWKFLEGKHFSHGTSVANNPGKAKDPNNGVWESAGRNLSRGTRNMTDRDRAKAEASNRRFARRAFAMSTAYGAALAATIEVPIAGLENWFHWKRGRKSGEQAFRDTARSSGAAAIGFVKGALLTALLSALVLPVFFLASLTGLMLLNLDGWVGWLGVLLPIIPVILLIPWAIRQFGGTTMWVVNSIHRVVQAAKHDFPLDEHRVYFCPRHLLQDHVHPRVGPHSLGEMETDNEA